jgi:hypothetical protein
MVSSSSGRRKTCSAAESCVCAMVDTLILYPQCSEAQEYSRDDGPSSDVLQYELGRWLIVNVIVKICIPQ